MKKIVYVSLLRDIYSASTKGGAEPSFKFEELTRERGTVEFSRRSGRIDEE